MSKQRVDKTISNLGILSRSECTKAIKSGYIYVNGERLKDPGFKVDPDVDVITYNGKQLDTRTFVYYVLNKPAGCITANEDKKANTVFEYIEDKRTDLSAVGRLDKDTTGVLLITNDGDLNHRLLSPKYHVPKTYEAYIDGVLTEPEIELLERGLDIGDEKPTLPAKARVLKVENGKSLVELIITEGRFHQVKRMFDAVGKPVITLHRKSFGPLKFDPTLKPGSYRELTIDELWALNVVANRVEPMVKYSVETSDMEIRDLFKYLYQSCFGCEHLVSDRKMAISKIKEEMPDCEKDNLPDIEELDGEFCRVHLKTLEKADGEAQSDTAIEAFTDIFIKSAEKQTDGEKRLEQKLKIAVEYAELGLIPFDPKELKLQIDDWRKQGFPPVHHSEKFRNAHHPAYRVIRKEYR